MKKILSDNEKCILQKMYDSGKSISELQKIFSLSFYFLKKNLTTDCNRSKKFHGKSIDKDEAQLLYNKEYTLGEIADYYGVSMKTVFRLGLSTRSTSEAMVIRHRNNEHFSSEGKQRLSNIAKDKGLGGYRPHPNKGQYYRNVWFDSKWEVKVAEDLDKNWIKWLRPTNGFVWNDDGRKYYPDFYLPDFDIYLDPKNPFLQKKDKEKIENASRINNIRVLILSEDQLSWEKIKTLIV